MLRNGFVNKLLAIATVLAVTGCMGIPLDRKDGKVKTLFDKTISFSQIQYIANDENVIINDIAVIKKLLSRLHLAKPVQNDNVKPDFSAKLLLSKDPTQRPTTAFLIDEKNGYIRVRSKKSTTVYMLPNWKELKRELRQGVTGT